MAGASILGQGAKIADSFQTLGISREMLKVLPDNEVAGVVAGVYRSLAKALHPDHHPESKGKFTEVSSAYQFIEPLLKDARLPQILNKIRAAPAVSAEAVNTQRTTERDLAQAFKEIEELKKKFISYVVETDRLAPDAKILPPGRGSRVERIPLHAYGVFTFQLVDQGGVDSDLNRGDYEVPPKYRFTVSTDTRGAIAKVVAQDPDGTSTMQHLVGAKIMGAVDATVLQKLAEKSAATTPDVLRIGGTVAQQEELAPFEVSEQLFKAEVLPALMTSAGYGDRLVAVQVNGGDSRFFVLPDIGSPGLPRRPAVTFKSGV